MAVREFLVQESSEHQQTAGCIVAPGGLSPYHDIPFAAFGTWAGMHRGDRHGDSENLSGGLARIADDGVHECRGFKSVPFNLQQCVFPAACHAYIRHEHILHGIVQCQTFVGRHDALT